jgi:hypothetical protein
MSRLFFIEKGGKNEPPKRAVVTLAEPPAQRSLDQPHRVALVSGALKRNVAAPPFVFMPVSRFHASKSDPHFEEKIQQAISGLNSGTYRSVREAAIKEGVSALFSFSGMSIN